MSARVVWEVDTLRLPTPQQGVFIWGIQPEPLTPTGQQGINPTWEIGAEANLSLSTLLEAMDSAALVSLRGMEFDVFAIHCNGGRVLIGSPVAKPGNDQSSQPEPLVPTRPDPKGNGEWHHGRKPT